MPLYTPRVESLLLRHPYVSVARSKVHASHVSAAIREGSAGLIRRVQSRAMTSIELYA